MSSRARSRSPSSRQQKNHHSRSRSPTRYETERHQNLSRSQLEELCMNDECDCPLGSRHAYIPADVRSRVDVIHAKLFKLCLNDECDCSVGSRHAYLPTQVSIFY